MKGIKIKLTKSGTFRAYYFSRPLFRWMPIKLEKAEALIAEGKAYRVAEDSTFA